MKKCFPAAILFFFLFLIACKKQSSTPFENSKTLIVGKWYVKSFTSRLFYNDIEVDSTFQKSFTNADFAQYFSDGSGVKSTNASPAPNLSIFRYTINGANLSLINATDGSVTPEIITQLTATNFSFNVERLIADPTAGRVYTAKDHYDFTK